MKNESIKFFFFIEYIVLYPFVTAVVWRLMSLINMLQTSRISWDRHIYLTHLLFAPTHWRLIATYSMFVLDGVACNKIQLRNIIQRSHLHAWRKFLLFWENIHNLHVDLTSPRACPVFNCWRKLFYMEVQMLTEIFNFIQLWFCLRLPFSWLFESICKN